MNKQEESAATETAGKTAVYLLLVSFGISVLSSFGGNSMEMMWNLMNVLQMFSFLLYTFVRYPDNVNSLFEYLSYANAENEYLSKLSFLLIPEDKFMRGDVNHKIGAKTFYVSSADKLPLMIGVVIILITVLLFDLCKCKKTNKF